MHSKICLLTLILLSCSVPFVGTNKIVYAKTDNVNLFSNNNIEMLEPSQICDASNYDSNNYSVLKINETEETDNNNNKNDKKYKTKYIIAQSNLRLKPNTDSKILMTLNYGTEVQCKKYNNDWYKVKYKNYKGYVYKDLISDKEVSYTLYDVPSNKIKSFMSYEKITLVSSEEYKYQLEAYTGNYGIRQYDGRYCVAIGSFFTTNVGIWFDLILENNTVIPCILADCKADKDTDSENIITEHDGSLAEFIVDVDCLSNKIIRCGDISKVCDSWDSEIVQVKLYDKRSEY